MADLGGGGGGRAEDLRLLERIAGGERAAVAELYDRYAPLLLAVAQRMLGQVREAEDLLHDVFLEVWQHAGEYEASRGSVRSWLLVRTRSRCLDRLRSARLSRAADGDLELLLIPAEDDPSAAAEHGRVREALAALTPDQRVVLQLNYFEGLSLAEIAAQLGEPLGTIKSRMLRAIARLRERLGAGEGRSE